MEKIIHRANSRGTAEHGWLSSSHTFSFANYHNPARMGFGKLRVLNDDFVEGGKGFATHSHKNMEIVSIPLAGGLKHKDSMGNVHIIRTGEIQVMSAGTGVTHSEYNVSNSEKVNFLQIWVMPKDINITPCYQQSEFDPGLRRNKLQTIVSPDGAENSLLINQEAYFSLARLEPGAAIEYNLNNPKNGVYIFVIDGQIHIANETLAHRDAIGLWGMDKVDISAAETAQDTAEILCIEVPRS